MNRTFAADANLNTDFSIKPIFPPEFALKDLDLLETLSTGIFGRTRLVKGLTDKKFYQLKILKKSKIIKLQQLEHIQNEVRIMSRVRFHAIVDLKAVFQDENSFFMLFNFISGGELYSHLRRATKFPESTYQFYAVEVACALCYLHKFDIVWRDLKPENILLTETGHVRLTEFSMAKIVPDRTYTLCGTIEYLCPELINGIGYSYSADWWALGILIYEMALGYPPFFGKNPFDVYKKILEGNIKYRDSSVSKATKNVVSAFCTANKKSRLGCGSRGFNDVKHHGFFHGIDWNSAFEELIAPPIAPTVSSDGDSSNYDYYPEETVEEASNLTFEEREMFKEFDAILERPPQTL